MTMDCRDALRLISLMLDGEISSADESALKTHLSQCAACREEQLGQTRLAEALSSMDTPLQSSEHAKLLRGRVYQAVAVRAMPRPSFAFRMTALAAILLLSVIVALLSHALLKARKSAIHIQAEAERIRNSESNPAAPFMALFAQNGNKATGVVENLQAFHVIQDYLAGAVRWMAVDGNQVELGVSGSQPMTTAARTEPQPNIIFVTFKYVERTKDGEINVLSNPQFALVENEEAVVRLKPADGVGRPRFRFRVKASQNADGRIHTDVTFADEGPAARSTSSAVESSISTKVMLDAAKPMLLGASGDTSQRRELYVWAESRLLPEREMTETNSGARPL